MTTTPMKKNDKPPEISIRRALGISTDDSQQVIKDFEKVIGVIEPNKKVAIHLSTEPDITKIFDAFKDKPDRTAMIFFYLGYSVAHVDTMDMVISGLNTLLPKTYVDDFVQMSMMFFAYRINMLLGNQKAKLISSENTDVNKAYR